MTPERRARCSSRLRPGVEVIDAFPGAKLHQSFPFQRAAAPGAFVAPLAFASIREQRESTRAKERHAPAGKIGATLAFNAMRGPGLDTEVDESELS